MKVKRYFAYFFLATIPLFSKAQQNFMLTRVNEFYSVSDLDVAKNQPVIIPDGISYTSLKIEIQGSMETPVLIGFRNNSGDMDYLTATVSDNTGEIFEGGHSSCFQIFETPQSALNLNFGNFEGEVKLHLFYARPLINPSLIKLFKTSNRCDKPEMISYTVWRQGLPDPKPPREETDVGHLVVHHSAGNNADTNYINTVRNIYLLHTQSNGWDDIGYNFLVAPNGIIFKGRDPQGVADEDNILGAHFCGKNSNTMGVCMLGDFMKVRPTSNAVFSLKYLLAWKLKKDRLDAFGQTKHPRETGNYLNNLCGHRDGCNTDCPGDSLYAMFPFIKSEAARIADSCGLVLKNKIVKPNKKITVFPNPCSGKLTINTNIELSSPSIEVYGLTGNSVFSGDFRSKESFDLVLPAGLYFYNIRDKREYIFHGIFHIQSQ